MVGSEKQIKWATDILKRIKAELNELIDNQEIIIYLASKTQVAINDFLTDEQLNKLMKEKINPKIIKEFDLLINNLEDKIYSYTKASDIISDLNGKSLQSLYRNMDYLYVTNGGIEVYKNRKKNKALFEEIKADCKMYWENWMF